MKQNEYWLVFFYTQTTKMIIDEYKRKPFKSQNYQLYKYSAQPAMATIYSSNNFEMQAGKTNKKLEIGKTSSYNNKTGETFCFMGEVK